MNIETTDTTTTTASQIPVGVATSASIKPLHNNAISRLHVELDGIANRPVTDAMCRESMLDCLLRCRKAVGGVWSSVNGDRVTSDISRLQGPIFERSEIKRWLANIAIRAISEQSNVVAECPSVKNLLAIAVPLSTDRRQQRPVADGEAPIQYPDHVLTMVTNNQNTPADTELLAVQCVVRAWRNWYTLTNIRQADKRLAATSALLELTRQMTQAASQKRALQTLANELQRYFDVRLVAIGLQKNWKAMVRLQAVSNIGDFDPNAQQSARLEAALSETVIRKQITQFPAIDPADQHLHLAHKRVAETFGIDAVSSVPLTADNGRIVGSVLLGGSAQKLFEPQTRNILTAASTPLGHALEIAEQLEGGLLRRTSRRLTKRIKSRLGIIALMCAVLTVAVMFIPLPYRIACRCTTEPTMRRYCLAPYDGLLENTFVEPGDEVSAGDLLARMQGRELNWELAGIVADQQRVQKERDVHRANLQVAQALISELESEKLAARKKLLQQRLNNLELRSPIDGVVLSGSLDRRQNYPVAVGQVVYEIAPTNELRLELAVPAAERPHITEGMSVTARMDGTGGNSVQGTISRIHPRSEIRNEQNVFVAEVIISNPDGDLKPGMEGTVRITAGRKPLGWTIGHHAWERLVTTVWW